jgi:hypothetical protein
MLKMERGPLNVFLDEKKLGCGRCMFNWTRRTLTGGNFKLRDEKMLEDGCHILT